MPKPRVSAVTQLVLDKLQDLGAYIHVKAVTTSSVYIKFEDSRLCSLRIADHKGKEKYKYKWNIRLDIVGHQCVQDRGTRRFYFGRDAIPLFLASIRGYHRAILRNEEQYGHGQGVV